MKVYIYSYTHVSPSVGVQCFTTPNKKPSAKCIMCRVPNAAMHWINNINANHLNPPNQSMSMSAHCSVHQYRPPETIKQTSMLQSSAEVSSSALPLGETFCGETARGHLATSWSCESWQTTSGQRAQPRGFPPRESWPCFPGNPSRKRPLYTTSSSLKNKRFYFIIMRKSACSPV